MSDLNERPTSAATRLDVNYGLAHKVNVIAEVSKSEVASVAQQAAVAPASMAMVDHHTPRSVVPAAKITTLLCAHGFCLGLGQAVAFGNCGGVLLFRSTAITTAIGRAALVAVFEAIFPHPRIFAFPAPRFAKVRGDVVKTKLCHRHFASTFRTFLRVHRFTSRHARSIATFSSAHPSSRPDRTSHWHSDRTIAFRRH